MATATIIVTVRLAPWRLFVARAFVYACIPLAYLVIVIGGDLKRLERGVRAVLSPFLKGGITASVAGYPRGRGAHMQPVLDLLKSKKFITAILGLVAVVGAHYLKLPEERILEITGMFAALLIGQGAASFGKEAKPASTSVSASSVTNAGNKS